MIFAEEKATCLTIFKNRDSKNPNPTRLLPEKALANSLQNDTDENLGYYLGFYKALRPEILIQPLSMLNDYRTVSLK